jgi:hypothetical protein
MVRHQTPILPGASVLQYLSRVLLRLSLSRKAHFALTASVREHFYELWWTTIFCASIR